MADVAHAVSTEFSRFRIQPEVDSVEHADLVAAQPPAVGDLEDDRVAEGRTAALTTEFAGDDDLIVGVVEERLQLVAAERPLCRPRLDGADVRCGVLVQTDLNRMGAEQPLALSRPAVRRIRDEPAELPEGALQPSQRGMTDPPMDPQIREPLVGELRAPPPRPLIGMRVKSANRVLPRRDGVKAQGARELLRTPAVEHGLEHLLRGMAQRPLSDQVQRDLPRRLGVSWQPAASSGHSHQMRDTCIKREAGAIPLATQIPRDDIQSVRSGQSVSLRGTRNTTFEGQRRWSAACSAGEPQHRVTRPITVVRVLHQMQYALV